MFRTVLNMFYIYQVLSSNDNPLEDDDIVVSTDEEDEDDDDDRELLDPPKALSDILESIVGAVFMDTGMSLDKTWKVFKPYLKPLIG